MNPVTSAGLTIALSLALQPEVAQNSREAGSAGQFADELPNRSLGPSSPRCFRRPMLERFHAVRQTRAPARTGGRARTAGVEAVNSARPLKMSFRRRK